MPLVTEQVSISLFPKGSLSVAVSISGCDASVTSIEADGELQTFTADAACSITMTAPPETASTIWEFSSSGVGSATWTYKTASTGTDTTGNTLFILDRDIASYSVSGGGSGYTAPTLSYQALGVSRTYTLTAKAAEVDIDHGTSWNVANPLTGSTSSERWQAPASDLSGTSAGGATIAPIYYNQFQPLVSFSVDDGGTGYSSPEFACVQLGEKFAVNASSTPTGEWVDSGCSYSFANPLTGSGPTERWIATSSSGTITSVTAIDPLYYNQLSQTLSYSVSGGGSQSAPMATALQFGTSYSFPLTTATTSHWLDASGRFRSARTSLELRMKDGSRRSPACLLRAWPW